MKKMLFFLFFLSIFAIFSGCDLIIGPTSEGINLVVIASNRANAHAIEREQIAIINEYVARAITRTGNMDGASGEINVRFIRGDGNPQEIHITDGQGKRVDLTFTSTDFRDRDSWIDGFMDPQEGIIAEFLRSDYLNAQHPEVDLIRALRRAADLFIGMSGSGGNYILIMDPGVSTTGYFNMRLNDIFWDLFLDDETRAGILNVDYSRATPIAQRLEIFLPNLTDVTVIFGQFGSFVCPQAHDIHLDVRNRLVDTWTEIIKLSGGTISIPEEYRWSQGTTPLRHYPAYIFEGTSLEAGTFNPPPVSSVIFPTPVPVGRGGVVASPEEVFGVDELGFEPDLAEFSNPAEAEVVLERITNHILRYLSSNPDNVIYVVGSTARVHQGVPNPGSISQERANLVRRTIISMLTKAGHDNLESQIISIGGECTQFPWRNNGIDEWASGVKNPDDAHNSRIVAIFSSARLEYIEELMAVGLLE